MKMKKALSLILGGALLIGSSSFIFANDAIQLATEIQEQPAVSSEVSLETTEDKTPKVTIEVLDEVIEKIDSDRILNIDDEEFEQELLELIEEILSELEEDANEVEEEVADDEEIDEDKENDEGEVKEDVTEEDKKLALENLYRNLLKYKLVYERVPAQAKPAIEKNMKNIQLKVVEYMIQINADLNTLIPELNAEEAQSELSSLKEKLESEGLTKEAKQELINTIAELENKISNYEEMSKLVAFVQENENWKKDLKTKIHQEFKIEKAKVKAESKLAKEEIKKIEEKTAEFNKKTMKKSIELEKKSKEKIFELDKKSHPVKETHPGRGNSKNK